MKVNRGNADLVCDKLFAKNLGNTEDGDKLKFSLEDLDCLGREERHDRSGLDLWCMWKRVGGKRIKLLQEDSGAASSAQEVKQGPILLLEIKVEAPIRNWLFTPWEYVSWIPNAKVCVETTSSEMGYLFGILSLRGVLLGSIFASVCSDS